MRLAGQELHAQHEMHAEEQDDRGVTESQLKMYIAVYKAMHADHDLTIDHALEPHGISLTEFRNIERRIQKEHRYVERVRDALLEFARSRTSEPAAGSGSDAAHASDPPHSE